MNPHVVTFHFRGLRLIKVPPYWLGDPGLYMPQLVENLWPHFRSSTRPIRLRAEAPRLLSWGYAHFRVQPNAACRTRQNHRVPQVRSSGR
jgi:hypothetical protein